jgi:hypothetical protein
MVRRFKMGRMRRWSPSFVAGIALCLWAAACASDNSRAAPGGNGSASTTAPGKGKKMAGEEFPAVVAFRAYTANKLGIAVDQVLGGPVSEAHANLFKAQRVGKIWAFVMWGPGTPKVEVRGWATPDGKVITLEQNLGPLLAEAGAWGGGVTPALGGKDLADRLAWSLSDATVEINNAIGVPYPELAMKDGAGTLRFVLGRRQPGPGGGGPVTRTLVEIALSKDQQATAISKPFTPTQP